MEESCVKMRSPRGNFFLGEMSRFHFDFHEPWHPRLYTVYTSCFLWLRGPAVQKNVTRFKNKSSKITSIIFSISERNSGFIWENSWLCFCLFIGPSNMGKKKKSFDDCSVEVGLWISRLFFFFFNSGEWWQPRCSWTQVKLSPCSGPDRSLERDSGSGKRLDDCDDSESQGQRQSQTVWESPQGHDTFHLLEILGCSQEYQSHSVGMGGEGGGEASKKNADNPSNESDSIWKNGLMLKIHDCTF